MKKILLITPEFFQYYKYISLEFENLGYAVSWYRDIPTTSTLTRALARLDKRLILSQVNSHLDKIINDNRDVKFDKIVFVYGMTFSFSQKMIKKLRSSFPTATMTIYLWDSVANLKGSDQIIPLFDYAFSFDKNDCNEKISFLPLFYINAYKEIANKKVREKYFCSYIGTAHPQKLKYINEISNELSSQYNNQFIYHYIPSRLKYIYHKIKDSEYKNIKFSSLSSKKLSLKDIANIFATSRCILDSAQAGQSGLTMRTFEVLGAKKKLITSNQTIQEYDFYNPNNIYIYKHGESIDFSSDFFTKPYEEIPTDIYEKYSITAWAKALLSTSKQ